MNDLRLKRNETFAIREGWIEKGINIIPSNNDCFKKDDGPRFFGLGSNMCKSLKYWLTATNIAQFGPAATLTNFGELLYKYDPYLESSFSWFMIHCELTTNFADAPVINKLFNCSYTKFTKEMLFSYLNDTFIADGYSIGAESSLESDINTALRSYSVTDLSNPENNMGCPFSKLGLLKNVDRKSFEKQTPRYSSLSYLVVYYSILKCVNSEDLNLEDLIVKSNNPLKIFNLNRPILFSYLDEMKNAGLINLIKTAGLNTIHINSKLILEDIFKMYFGEVL